MKYLEEPKLTWLNSVLNKCEVGDRMIDGRLEAYSCKMAKTDRKLAKAIDDQYKFESSTTPIDLGTSPLGSMTDSGSRKLLLHLISTMNASFPDYDFSTVGPDQFYKEGSVKLAMNSINTQLAEMVEVYNNGFLERLWTSIREVIDPDNCEVYSYIPDMDSDPFSDGTLWSFNYFFFNKNMKKMLYFTCMSGSKFYGEEDEFVEDEMSDEDSSHDMMDTLDWEDGI